MTTVADGTSEGRNGGHSSTMGGTENGGRVGLVRRFTIPSLPPSVNALYQIIYSQKRVELHPEARRWKSSAKEHVPRFSPSVGSLVAVDATFYYRFHYNNGKPRVFDAANLLKLLIDCVAEKCGFNDCLVRHGSWSSINSDVERVEVVLREVKI